MLLIVVSCSKKVGKDISVVELDKLAKNTKNVVLIDVRDSEKYIKDHIPGSISVPFSKLRKFSKNLDKRKSIVLITEKGASSYNEADVLMKSGFERVYNLVGGITQWRIWQKQIGKKNTQKD